MRYRAELDDDGELLISAAEDDDEWFDFYRHLSYDAHSVEQAGELLLDEGFDPPTEWTRVRDQRAAIVYKSALTPDLIARRIARVEDVRHANDQAHSAEDELLADVLNAIASGHPEPAELAREALKVRDVKFTRYYA